MVVVWRWGEKFNQSENSPPMNLTFVFAVLAPIAASLIQTSLAQERSELPQHIISHQKRSYITQLEMDRTSVAPKWDPDAGRPFPLEMGAIKRIGVAAISHQFGYSEKQLRLESIQIRRAERHNSWFAVVWLLKVPLEFPSSGTEQRFAVFVYLDGTCGEYRLVTK